jgi:hypothetical protein
MLIQSLFDLKVREREGKRETKTLKEHRREKEAKNDDFVAKPEKGPPVGILSRKQTSRTRPFLYVVADE